MHCLRLLSELKERVRELLLLESLYFFAENVEGLVALPGLLHYFRSSSKSPQDLPSQLPLAIEGTLQDLLVVSHKPDVVHVEENFILQKQLRVHEFLLVLLRLPEALQIEPDKGVLELELLRDSLHLSLFGRDEVPHLPLDVLHLQVEFEDSVPEQYFIAEVAHYLLRE